jgi:hypothetical protein
MCRVCAASWTVAGCGLKRLRSGPPHAPSAGDFRPSPWLRRAVDRSCRPAGCGIGTCRPARSLPRRPSRWSCPRKQGRSRVLVATGDFRRPSFRNSRAPVDRSAEPSMVVTFSLPSRPRASPMRRTSTHRPTGNARAVIFTTPLHGAPPPSPGCASAPTSRRCSGRGSQPPRHWRSRSAAGGTSSRVSWTTTVSLATSRSMVTWGPSRAAWGFLGDGADVERGGADARGRPGRRNGP